MAQQQSIPGLTLRTVPVSLWIVICQRSFDPWLNIHCPAGQELTPPGKDKPVSCWFELPIVAPKGEQSAAPEGLEASIKIVLGRNERSHTAQRKCLYTCQAPAHFGESKAKRE